LQCTRIDAHTDKEDRPLFKSTGSICHWLRAQEVTRPHESYVPQHRVELTMSYYLSLSLTHTDIPMQTHTNKYTHTHTCMHTHTHADTHKQIHTHTHMHAHTHTCCTR